jgi:hypothetical protein
MPITSDEFKKGRSADSLEGRIEQFLESHNDSAYSLLEICEELLGKPKSTAGVVEVFAYAFGGAWIANKSMETLLQEDKIETKEINGTPYYKWKK